MRSLPLAALILVLAQACTAPTSQATEEAATAWTPQTLGDSIALAHGYDRWSEVERFEFAFDVEMNDTLRVERDWVWYPGTDSVVRTVDDADLGYVRGTLRDEAAREADKQFINDSYWVLMPFWLVWSKGGFSESVERDATAPISGEDATKYTIVYATEGGYTPGDAYDLYVDADYRLREWVYRKGGQFEPTMTMSWDGYRDMEGLYLPTRHEGDSPLRILHPELAVYHVK